MAAQITTELTCEECGEQFKVQRRKEGRVETCNECYREDRVSKVKETLRNTEDHWEFVDALEQLSRVYGELPVKTYEDTYIIDAEIRHGDGCGSIPDGPYIHRMKEVSGKWGVCQHCGFDRIVKTTGLTVDGQYKKECRHCGKLKEQQ